MDQRDRISLESIYMEFALLLSKRSTCDRAQVGTIITSYNLEEIYAIGYNGGAKGQNNNCESNKPGLCGHIHAEENALIKCFVNDPSKLMFTTMLSCRMCAKKMVNSGFSKVYYHTDYREQDSIKILNQAGIQLEKL